MVKNILNLADYKNVLEKHIIDNSCGDGAFLCEIVQIYINEAKNLSKNEIKNHLETFIKF